MRHERHDVEAERPTPSLGYATFDSDGTPDWHEEAERLINAGASPGKLRRHFRKARLAANYWAKSMRRRYPVRPTSGPCCGCGAPATSNLSVDWSVSASPAVLGLPVMRPVFVDYVTHHAVCDTCVERIGNAAKSAGRLFVVASWVTYLGIGLLGLGILVRLLGITRGLNLRLIPLGIFLGLSFAAACFQIWGDLRMKRGLPSDVNRQRRRGIRFLGFDFAEHIDDLDPPASGP